MICCFLFALGSLTAAAQDRQGGHGPFVRLRAGLSSYLGDNNTVLLNPEAFRVPGKKPYSFGVEVGYQFSKRWRAAVGVQAADYPIITRFNRSRDITRDPTTRRTYQLLVRYLMSERRLAPYVHAGFHLTFGDVTIFEAMRIWKGQPLNVQHHYIYGPLFGLGLDYAVSRTFSLFAEVTTHATLMDDSVDGRLPLGPPQPTSFGEQNRFGTFDLLSTLGVGLRYRPWCHCATPARQKKARAFHTLMRLSRSFRYNGLTASFQVAPPFLERLFFGLEGGLIPRSIFVRYRYPDGQQSTDETFFTGAFLGLSARFFPLSARPFGLAPHLGATVAVPAHVQFIAGLDYALNASWSLGVEGRYVHCPDRRRAIDGYIGYRMRRACTVDGGVGLTLSHTLR